MKFTNRDALNIVFQAGRRRGNLKTKRARKLILSIGFGRNAVEKLIKVWRMCGYSNKYGIEDFAEFVLSYIQPDVKVFIKNFGFRRGVKLYALREKVYEKLKQEAEMEEKHD